MHYVNDIGYETKEEADAAFAILLEAEAAERMQQAKEEAVYEKTRPLNPVEVLTAMFESTDISESIPDTALSRMAPYFTTWASNVDYIPKNIVSYKDCTYRCLQAHISREGWEPDISPSLWAKILPGQDGEIGEWVQPDSTNPYMMGDKVIHNGLTWESNIDYNVYEPGIYGWIQI